MGDFVVVCCHESCICLPVATLRPACRSPPLPTCSDDACLETQLTDDIDMCVHTSSYLFVCDLQARWLQLGERMQARISLLNRVARC